MKSLKKRKSFSEFTRVHPDMDLNTLIEETKSDFCKMTGFRILKEPGIELKSRSVKWLLTDRDREQRLARAKEYESMSDDFWKRVVFTEFNITARHRRSG